MIKITKTDVLWNYIAQFFSLASGLITLPLILKMLTVEEIALNYIFLTVSSLVLLFDFGFSPQFSRNVSYVYGGAQTLKKEGIEDASSAEVTINYSCKSRSVCLSPFSIVSATGNAHCRKSIYLQGYRWLPFSSSLIAYLDNFFSLYCFYYLL